MKKLCDFFLDTLCGLKIHFWKTFFCPEVQTGRVPWENGENQL